MYIQIFFRVCLKDKKNSYIRVLISLHCLVYLNTYTTINISRDIIKDQ